MNARLRFSAGIAALPILVLLGCANPETQSQPQSQPSQEVPAEYAGVIVPPETKTGTVVVGLTSDLRAGIDVTKLHVVMSVDGEVVSDEVLKLGDGELDFPIELAFTDRADGARVDAEVEVFGESPDTAVLLRSASTRVVGGEKVLLRMPIEAACVVHVGEVPCEGGLTCEEGACRDPFTSPDDLETYTDAWSELKPDACKPVGAGDPVIVLGQGQVDYQPLGRADVYQIEEGGQGGFHIWLAFRIKNLHRFGSITEVTGSVPELGADLPPFAVIFEYTPDEGGYCKLSGTHFRLDQPLDIHDLLGKVIQVNVKMTDSDGSVGTVQRSVQLSSDYIPRMPD